MTKKQPCSTVEGAFGEGVRAPFEGLDSACCGAPGGPGGGKGPDLGAEWATGGARVQGVCVGCKEGGCPHHRSGR